MFQAIPSAGGYFGTVVTVPRNAFRSLRIGLGHVACPEHFRRHHAPEGGSGKQARTSAWTNPGKRHPANRAARIFCQRRTLWLAMEGLAALQAPDGRPSIGGGYKGDRKNGMEGRWKAMA
jgi:hypothetical protein